MLTCDKMLPEFRRNLTKSLQQIRNFLNLGPSVTGSTSTGICKRPVTFFSASYRPQPAAALPPGGQELGEVHVPVLVLVDLVEEHHVAVVHGPLVEVDTYVFSNCFSNFWQKNWQTLRGPFSAISTQKFTGKYSFE